MHFPKQVPALVLSLIILLVSGCAGGDSPAATPAGGQDGGPLSVKVGVVQSLSGAGGVYGVTVVRGIELAVREINASQDRFTFSVDVEDDQSAVGPGVSAFELFSTGDYTAIIGPTLSNVAFEALKQAQQARVPVLAATTTALGITDAGDYVFRVALTEDVVVPAAIKAVSDRSPVRNAVLVLESSDAFSRSSADAMRKGIAAVGARLVAEVDLSSPGDPMAALAGLDAQEIDTFLVTPLVEQSARVVAAIRGAGFAQKIIGGNSFNTLDIARQAGPAIEDAYVGAAWNIDSNEPLSRAFVAAYSGAYGSAPDQFAVQGYSSVYLLLDALERAGSTDAAALRGALASARSVETPLGPVTMSPSRDALHQPVVQQYRGGRLVVLGSP